MTIKMPHQTRGLFLVGWCKRCNWQLTCTYRNSCSFWFCHFHLEIEYPKSKEDPRASRLPYHHRPYGNHKHPSGWTWLHQTARNQKLGLLLALTLHGCLASSAESTPYLARDYALGNRTVRTTKVVIFCKGWWSPIQPWTNAWEIYRKRWEPMTDRHSGFGDENKKRFAGKNAEESQPLRMGVISQRPHVSSLAHF